MLKLCAATSAARCFLEICSATSLALRGFICPPSGDLGGSWTDGGALPLLGGAKRGSKKGVRFLLCSKAVISERRACLQARAQIAEHVGIELRCAEVAVGGLALGCIYAEREVEAMWRKQ
jgi:hypothetical protein